MELKYLLKILRAHWKEIFATAIILALVVGGASLYWPTRYRSELTVYVQRVPENPPSGDYTYDGFYAQQAAEAYADTVVGLLQSREIIRRALVENKAPADAQAVRRVEKQLKVEKVAPQLINVSLTMPTQEGATSLVKGIAAATREQVKTLNLQKNQAMEVKLVSPDPLESSLKPWVGLNVVVAFAGGLILGTGGVLVRGYLKDD